MSAFLDSPKIRELRPPLTREQFRPLESDCRIVQFSEPMSRDELRRVALFLAEYPSVVLRVYGHRVDDTLDFLEHFGAARHVWLEIYDLRDISGLRFLRPDLETLGLGQTRRRFSLRGLERFGRLRSLWVYGHQREFEVVGELRALRRLSLRSITLPDLSALRPLAELEDFELKLGGTRDLRHLPEVGRIQQFEAWLVRGLADLEPLAGMRSLRSLFLQALKQVMSLPSFAPLAALRRVHLEAMKGLHDLAPVAAAPALEELLAIQMGHLDPEAFRPFVGHPTLRAARIGLGERKNAAVEAMLALPNARD